MGKRFGLHPVSPSSLRQDVLHAVRSAILAGTLPAGERLVEETLAGELGVSRGTLREVIRQLEQEGLIETQPHRGSFVTPLDVRELDAIFELRCHLESVAVRQALASHVTAPVSSLSALIQEMQESIDAGDMAQLAEQDVRFHELIVQTCGYPTWLRIWRTIDGAVRRHIYTINSRVSAFLQNTARSHLPIVAALRAGDPDQAEAAIRYHIMETLPWLKAGAGTGQQPAPTGCRP